MKSKLAIFLCAAAMLASCGGNSSSQATGLTSLSSTDPDAPLYLTWIAKGKLVVDLIRTADARFNYGDAALRSNTNTVDLNDNATFGCTTQMEGMVFNFVFFWEAEGNYGVSVNRAVEGNSLTEFCDLHKDNFKGKTRGYLAVSGGTTVEWDKDKNPALNEKIQALIVD